MNFKAFTFNPTLFRRNLSRYWPLWGLPAILGSLVPIALISMYLRGDNTMGSNAALEITSAYYEIVADVVPIIMLSYSILVAMAVWGWLCVPRSVGLMHALPIRREGIFLTSFLSGLAMLALPCTAVGFFCVLLSLIARGFSLVPLVVTVLCVAGEGFFYFSTATAAAFLTGNVFAMPALYFLFHFLAPAVDLLFSLLASNSIFGVQYGYSGAAQWLCPTLYLMERVNATRVYEEPNPNSFSAYGVPLTSVKLEHTGVIAAYVLVGVVLLVISLLLYRARRSECAGDVIAMTWGKPIFRYGITALAAISGGQLLYVLFSDGFDLSGQYHVLPLALSMTVAGALGYYAASMLLAKSLRVFRGSWRGLVLTAAGCLVVSAVMGLDLLGVGRRVPDADSIYCVQLNLADNTYNFYAGEDDAENIERVRALHQAVIADREAVQTRRPYPGAWRNVTEAHPYEVEDDSNTLLYEDGTRDRFEYCRVYLDYSLKNGLSVRRSYDWFVTESRMDTEGTADYAVNAFVNSPEIKQARLHARDNYKAEGGDIYLEKRDQSYSLSTREAETVLAAIARDADNGDWGTYLWFGDDSERYAISFSLNFSYDYKDRDGSTRTRYDYTNINIRPAMNYTIAALKDLGYVTDEDLITVAEMRAYWEKHDLAERDAEEYDAEEEAVIGGADVPVPIYVTEE